jgi:threonine dehydrogenase-like Zn-dependent dehydrogenase
MTLLEAAVPESQLAVQLIGPGQLVLNTRKEVRQPGPYEILVKVEAVGLCFSDLKLLKQFSAHPRKGEILSGIDREILDGCPSYVPGQRPGVPGHEVACRVVAVGDEVRQHKVGERCLVQTDYRTLPTQGSNAAFGYTFEGGLQEYVLLDERIVVEPGTGERYLIPVPESLSSSAVALVEPWSCVEGAYASTDRRTILPGGRLLVVVDAGHAVAGLTEALAACGGVASVTAVVAETGDGAELAGIDVPVSYVDGVADLPLEAFDDVVYFGAAKDVIELLNDRLATAAMINIVLGGAVIGAPVSVGVGRVHYGLTRWIGTTGTRAIDSYSTVPSSGELRSGDTVLIVGAGGPMGQMHVIRSLCTTVDGVSVVGTDVDDTRLAALRRKAGPLARRNGVPLRLVNTVTEPLDGRFSHQVVLVPSGAGTKAVEASADGGLIDIFAGIPATTRQDLDLDRYIATRSYLFGTSGSVIGDMKTVLAKVAAGELDTNSSVDAISGMAGAIDGLSAVSSQLMAGKVVIYPELSKVWLIPLAQIGEHFPTVAAKLDHGQWCVAAERELLRVAGSDQVAGSGPAAGNAEGDR